MARFLQAALAVFFLISAQGIAAAQQRQAQLPFPNLMQGSPEEEAACAPDSAKYCKRFEPDPLAVLGCLQQNRGRISKACQTVLRNRGV